jgi:hypothetical protein
MFASASDFTQHLNPLHSVFGSTLVALIPIALLLVLLAVARVTAWLAVIVGAVITVIMAITIWHSPGGPTIGAWGIGAGTGIWVIDWITFWGVVIYNTLLEPVPSPTSGAGWWPGPPRMCGCRPSSSPGRWAPCWKASSTLAIRGR